MPLHSRLPSFCPVELTLLELYCSSSSSQSCCLLADIKRVVKVQETFVCIFYFYTFAPVWMTQHLNKFHPVPTQLLILQSLKIMSDHSALENSIQAHDN